MNVKSNSKQHSVLAQRSSKIVLGLALAASALLSGYSAAPGNAEPTTGRKVGTSHVLAAHETHTYYVRYAGGEWAEANATSTTNSDIDIRVYGPDGNKVDEDTLPDSFPETSWYVSDEDDDEVYTIKITNASSAAARYTIMFE